MPLAGSNLLVPGREKVISSFDFIDIAKNVAVEIFYGGHSQEDTTSIYTLTPTRFYSTRVSTKGTTNSSGSFTKGIDLDFDVLISAPIQLKGDLVINIPLAVDGSASITGDGYTTAEVLLIDVNAVETSLGTAQSQTIRSAAGALIKTNTAVKITIPKTKIKVGETIRLTVQAWGSGVGTTSDLDLYIGHDPFGRDTNDNVDEIDWGDTVSILQMQMPIVLNL